MLVIVSDLHLNDGTTGSCIPAHAFEIFQDRLEQMAEEASWRDVNIYEPIDSIDLVLLGDILDVLHSTKWTDEKEGKPGYARPWTHQSNPEDFAKKVEIITNGIITNNTDTLDIIRNIAHGIKIPHSRDKRSKILVPVNIHYVIGNHDWYYHLQGDHFNSIRKTIVEKFHLKNDWGKPFPYDLEEEEDEYPAITRVFQQHSVFGRHGDIYDSFNYAGKDYGRDHASLADALAVELFNPISDRIKSRISIENYSNKFRTALDEMGNVRPGLATPIWLTSILEKYKVGKEDKETIAESWQDLVWKFLNDHSTQDFLDVFNKSFEPDKVDLIKLLLEFSRILSMPEDFSSLILNAPFLEKLFFNPSRYEKQASLEKKRESRKARFIVYGHTHEFVVHPLSSTDGDDGKPFDQLYINSGTWHTLHELCRENIWQKRFVMHKTMSYLGFYKDTERKGRAFETWSGTLDI